MSNLIEITEDELNFILGNDAGENFDVDVALAQAPEGGDPETSISDLLSRSKEFADPPVLGNLGDFDVDIVDGNILPPRSLDECEPPQDPTPCADSQHPRQVKNGGGGLLESEFADVPVVDDFPDFAFDMSIVDDLACDDFPDVTFDMSIVDNVVFAVGADPHDLIGTVTRCGTPDPPLQGRPTLSPPSPFGVVTTVTESNSTEATPATASEFEAWVPENPSRKRRLEVPDYVFAPASSDKQQQTASGSGPCLQELHRQPDPAACHTKATEARIARNKRRRLRARGQAIHLVGRGDVSEIERRAVADSNLAVSERCQVSDFSKSFDFEKFVGESIEGICRTMMEASEANDASEGSRDADSAPSARPIVSQPDGNAGKARGRTALAPPAARRRSSLPSGKDPESRRLRRLMRNRLSAQASRDRRKKAIADARRMKSLKESEIEALEETVSEEIQRMILLEKAVSFAREYLGPDKYSKVAAASTGHGATKSTVHHRCHV